MSGLHIFLAFFIGGMCGIGVMCLMFAARDSFNVNLLTPEDIDRLWIEACNDMSSDVLGNFAHRVEEFVTH